VIKYAVRQAIVNNGTLAALVGTRVYPSQLPNPYTLPSIVLHTIYDVAITPHSGKSGEVRETGVQCNVLAHSDLTGMQIIEGLINLFHAIAPLTVVLPSGAGTIYILSGFLEDSQDSKDNDFEREKEVLKIVDFKFLWRR